MIALAPALVQDAECLQVQHEPDPVFLGLSQSTQRIETTFLAAGVELIRAVGLLERAETAYHSAEVACSADNLGKAETSVLALIGCMNDLPASLSQEDRQLSAITESVAEVSSCLVDLKRIVRTIEIVGIHARITAAATSGNHDLRVFSEEVSEYTHQAMALISSLHRRQQELAISLSHASKDQANFAVKFADQNALAVADLENSLAGADEWRNRRLKVASTTLSSVRSQKTRISTIIGSLQIGDTTRQRLEHVSSALEDIEPGDVQAGTVISLQVRQLVAALADFDPATAQLERELTDLGTAICGTHLDNSFSVDASESFSVTSLAASIRYAASMLADAEDIRRKSDRLATSALEIARLLANDIAELHRLEQAMRIVSLNTALACSRIGMEGRALSAISQQLRELVHEMVECSESFSGPMAAITNAAYAISDREQGTERIAELSLEAASRVEDIERIESDLEVAESLSRDVAAEVSDLVTDTRLQLDDHLDISSGVMNVIGQLRMRCAEGDTSLPATVEERLLRRYTMQCERDVHALFFGAPITAVETISLAPVDDDLAAFLF